MALAHTLARSRIPYCRPSAPTSSGSHTRPPARWRSERSCSHVLARQRRTRTHAGHTTRHAPVAEAVARDVVDHDLGANNVAKRLEERVKPIVRQVGREVLDEHIAAVERVASVARVGHGVAGGATRLNGGAQATTTQLTRVGRERSSNATDRPTRSSSSAPAREPRALPLQKGSRTRSARDDEDAPPKEQTRHGRSERETRRRCVEGAMRGGGGGERTKRARKAPYQPSCLFLSLSLCCPAGPTNLGSCLPSLLVRCSHAPRSAAPPSACGVGSRGVEEADLLVRLLAFNFAQSSGTCLYRKAASISPYLGLPRSLQHQLWPYLLRRVSHPIPRVSSRPSQTPTVCHLSCHHLQRHSVVRSSQPRQPSPPCTRSTTTLRAASARARCLVAVDCRACLPCLGSSSSTLSLSLSHSRSLSCATRESSNDSRKSATIQRSHSLID